ncbi:MAG: peptidoglycan-binding protein [Candidatus Promineifilaceae bacterium]|nr:peptidoglycan-binding protein [Candidatus Promineifilaceae bacterium]
MSRSAKQTGPDRTASSNAKKPPDKQEVSPQQQALPPVAAPVLDGEPSGRGTARLQRARLLRLQRRHGNAFVCRRLDQRRQPSHPSPLRRPTLAATRSRGKLVLGYRGALPGLQRQENGDDKKGAVLTNGRFAGIKALERIAQGTGELSRGDNGPAVLAVQQALFDMGYPLPRFRVDGKIGSETREAIRRFRADHKQGPGNALDGPALSALDKAAPPPGKSARKSIDYDKLLADGKLTFTVALGYDESDFHKRATKAMLEFFKDEGFTGTIGADGLGLFKKESTFLVTNPDTGAWEGKIVTVQIRFITPSTQHAKEEFARGLSSDDIAIYKGHARYGTGPDFDPKKSAAENFTIGVGSALHKSGKLKRPPGMDSSWYRGHHKMRKILGKRANDLQKLERSGQLDPKKYQVWFFNACSTLHYLDELRSPDLAGSKTRQNLDIVGTRNSIYSAAGIAASQAFIKSVLESATLAEMMSNMQGAVDRWVDEKTAEGHKVKEQTDMFFREGFGDNPNG